MTFINGIWSVCEAKKKQHTHNIYSIDSKLRISGEIKCNFGAALLFVVVLVAIITFSLVFFAVLPLLRLFLFSSSTTSVFLHVCINISLGPTAASMCNVLFIHKMDEPIVLLSVWYSLGYRLSCRHKECYRFLLRCGVMLGSFVLHFHSLTLFSSSLSIQLTHPREKLWKSTYGPYTHTHTMYCAHITHSIYHKVHKQYP